MHAIIRGEHGHAVALLWLTHVPSCGLAICPRQVCERGFSHMKLIKTDITSNLSEKSLSNGILNRLHLAPIAEFDPSPAIDYWLSVKQR